jgi:hypothetical protein
MYWPQKISERKPLLLLGWDPIEPADKEQDANWLVLAYQHIAPEPWAEIAMVVGDLSAEDMAIYAAACDRGSVPLVLQVRTWPGEWLPQWRQWNVSVAEWSDLARRHPSVVGAQVVELNCFGFSTEERMYVSQLMAACADQEKFLSWQEANDGTNFWVDVGLDREFFRSLCQYGAYVFPQWEMNIARSMYLCQASVFGLWLTHVVEHWGVEAQSWYWSGAGYTALNTVAERFDQGYRQGDRNAFPPTMWGQMLLLGASAGASIYSIEPTRRVVWADGPELALAPPYRDVIAPFFASLHAMGIPSRTEVAQKIQVAYHADFASEYDAQVSDVDYFRGRATDSWRHGRQLSRGSGLGTWWKGSYGIRDERDMIPGTGQYYWLPVLPKFTDPDQLRSFPALVTPNSFAAESEVRQFLDEYYPRGAIDGQGFWAEFENQIFLCHSYENTDIEQTIRIQDLEPFISLFQVTWGPHAYAMIRREENCCAIHQQGRGDHSSTWRLVSQKGLTISVDPGCRGALTYEGRKIGGGESLLLVPGDHQVSVRHPAQVCIRVTEGSA